MWNKRRLPVIAGGVAVVMAAVAVAQTSSSSSSNSSAQPSATTQTSSANDASTTQPSATNPSNLPATELGTTEQQSKAPVVDPQAAAQNAADAKAAVRQSSPGQVGGTAAGNAVNNSNTQSSATSEWPAPQRYEANRTAESNASTRSGGASLGVNVTGSNDARGIIIQRVRPGTAADQMGLQQRDRILSLNGQPVVSVEEFISAIRGMNAGDEVQITIDRSGSSRDIAGRLESLRDAVAIGDRPVGSIVGRARDFVGRATGENMQTSYEDRGTSNPSSRDFDVRLARVEQQIEQLVREVSELRSAIKPGSVTSAGSPSVNPSGLPTTPGTTPDASALRTTPGQPSTEPQPQSR